MYFKFDYVSLISRYCKWSCDCRIHVSL